MSIQHYFYIDTPVSGNALRDALVHADVGLDQSPDSQHHSNAISVATSASIIENLAWRTMRPDNGVVATRIVNFSFRKKNLEEFYTQTVRGITALLRAFPDANAYWMGWDAEIPVLLRREGDLVLSQQESASGELWDSERQPCYVAMVDVPYTVAPLGPWKSVPVESPALERLR